MANARVGIIGNGNVGSALQRGLSRAGYEVQATGRQPARVGEVGNWADVVVLAVPFSERKNAVRELGDGVQGKPLVDVTNALDGNLRFAGSLERSGAEELQRMARGARVVKAFNTVFAQAMDSGEAAGETLTMFAAGDDPEAKRAVLAMGRAIGFDAVDAGPLEHARWLEPLGYLNIALATKAGHGPDVGFRFVHGQGKAGKPGSLQRGSRPPAAAPHHAPRRERTTARAAAAKK